MVIRLERNESKAQSHIREGEDVLSSEGFFRGVIGKGTGFEFGLLFGVDGIKFNVFLLVNVKRLPCSLILLLL